MRKLRRFKYRTMKNKPLVFIFGCDPDEPNLTGYKGTYHLGYS